MIVSGGMSSRWSLLPSCRRQINDLNSHQSFIIVTLIIMGGVKSKSFSFLFKPFPNMDECMNFQRPTVGKARQDISPLQNVDPASASLFYLPTHLPNHRFSYALPHAQHPHLTAIVMTISMRMQTAVWLSCYGCWDGCPAINCESKTASWRGLPGTKPAAASEEEEGEEEAPSSTSLAGAHY